MIGRSVARQLAQAGREVSVLDLPGAIDRVGTSLPDSVTRHAGSILDPAFLGKALAGCDGVVHLAARLGVQRTERNTLGCLTVNIDGTRCVLEAARRVGVRKVVFASSSEVYGEPLTNPITEQTTTQGKTVYAVSKLAGEELCKAYAQRYGLDWSAMRYFNCYGPGQVAQFVVPRFMRLALAGQPPMIFGDGQQMRSYTYVDDAATATIAALDREAANGRVINIGSDRDAINLRELAELIIRLAGREGQIVPRIARGFDNADRPAEREIFFRYCKPHLAATLLDWHPRVDLETGLSRVIASGELYEDWAHEPDEEA